MASIIFLDQPAGTGFSYARTPEAYITNDTSAAIYSYNFLRKVGSLSCISNYFSVYSVNIYLQCIYDV